MLENLDTNKRMMLAVGISLVFFMVYDYFFIPKNQIIKEPTQTSKELASNTAPMNANKQDPISAPDESYSADSIATIKTKDSIFYIDQLGRISQSIVTEKGREKTLSLFGKTNEKPLEVRFSDSLLNKEAFEVKYTTTSSELDVMSEAKEIVLTQKLSKGDLVKKITFYPNDQYTVDISFSNPVEFFITPGIRPEADIDMMTVHGALILESDETIEIIEDGDATGAETFVNAKIASAFSRYYATFFYNFDSGLEIFVNKTANGDPLLFVKSKDSKLLLNGYIGPKYVNKISAIDKRLNHVIEYGVFTFLSAPLFKVLDTIFKFTGNWGWTIIIFITLVRLVLFPLSYKGMVSMNKLKEISPKIKEVQKKYKGDPQKMQVHMMELYKKHGANPMGGCLPLLLQIPIFFAIYRVLLNSIELRGAEWLYVYDLSAMDPYYILPILMGVSMFIQQRLTPQNFSDPMQEKIMKYLPVVFTFFFFTFPAGLVLYWVANNILSIVQQYYVNVSLAKKSIKA